MSYAIAAPAHAAVAVRIAAAVAGLVSALVVIVAAVRPDMLSAAAGMVMGLMR